MKKIALWSACICLILGFAICPAAAETSGTNAPQNNRNLSSPEAAWNYFKTAMLLGNYDMALECCCPENNKFVQRITKFGEIKTRKVFMSVTSIEKIFQDKDTAKYKVYRDINGTKLTTFVSFAKIGEQWKIASY